MKIMKIHKFAELSKEAIKQFKEREVIKIIEIEELPKTSKRGKGFYDCTLILEGGTEELCIYGVKFNVTREEMDVCLIVSKL